MATPLDTKARATALRLLTKFGTTSTYTHRSSPVYNPETLENVSTETVVNPKVFISSPSWSDLKAGVLETEKTCLMAGAAVDFYPSAMDTLVVDGETYTIRPVHPVYSGDQVALWILGVKK